ncbi:MAG TPA: hypothetical protein VIU11_17505, partial [Nakamurella sp.]
VPWLMIGFALFALGRGSGLRDSAASRRLISRTIVPDMSETPDSAAAGPCRADQLGEIAPELYESATC